MQPNTNAHRILQQITSGKQHVWCYNSQTGAQFPSKKQSMSYCLTFVESAGDRKMRTTPPTPDRAGHQRPHRGRCRALRPWLQCFLLSFLHYAFTLHCKLILEQAHVTGHDAFVCAIAISFLIVIVTEIPSAASDAC